MKLLTFFFAALLAGALSFPAAAQTSKAKSKTAAASAKATPRPKSTKSTASKTKAATPKPRAQTSGSTPKATPEPAADSATPAARATPDATATPAPKRAPAATLEPEDLREFDAQPPRVQQLITAALALTKLNLTYTYGSADPARGGMDCSGTMYHLLRAQGFSDVPRDSSGQYAWARKNGPFFAVVGKTAKSFEFDDLLPGDLLFWTGTYDVQREIPISHVMLYLGTEKKTKNRVMFGASDGRSYAGIQRWGVSVFDFKMPREGNGSRVDFVGYGRIPALRSAPNPAADPAPESASDSPAASADTGSPAVTKPAATPKSSAGAKQKSSTPRPGGKSSTGSKGKKAGAKTP